jgi:hypothetical protein
MQNKKCLLFIGQYTTITTIQILQPWVKREELKLVWD